MRAILTNPEHIYNFITGNKAVFTILNTTTEKRFTFKIKKHKEKDLHFVYLMTGCDNNKHYSFFGTIFNKNVFKVSSKSKVPVSKSQGIAAFDWLFKNYNRFPSNIQFWHEGSCCQCGRRLTVPTSIASGIGPECSKRR